MDAFMKRVEKRRKAQARWVARMLSLSMLVFFATFAGFHIDAITKSYTVRVLDCPYAREGALPVAHVHNEDCLDSEGNMICVLPEREDHRHTEECYADILVCEAAEEENEHYHSEECYEKENIPVCGKEEFPVHIHDDACFRTEEMSIEDRNEDVNDENVHADDYSQDADLKEAEEFVSNPDDSAEEDSCADQTIENIGMNENDEAEETDESAEMNETSAEVPMPAQSFLNYTGGIRVAVEAPEGAFPEGTAISVTPVNGNVLKSVVSDAVNGEILEVQAVDISFLCNDQEIDPLIPIQVSITPELSQNSEQTTQIVHIDDQNIVEVVKESTEIDPGTTELVFEAETFSIYAVVYSLKSVQLKDYVSTDLLIDESTDDIEASTLQLTVQEKRFAFVGDESPEEKTDGEEAVVTLKRYRAEIPTATVHFKMADDQTELADEAVVPTGATVAITAENTINIVLETNECKTGEEDLEEAYNLQIDGKNALFTVPDSVTSVDVSFQEDPGHIDVSYIGDIEASDESFRDDTDYEGSTVSITSGGSETFHNLPLSETDTDRIYVYRYYVEEDNLTAYETQYQVGGGAIQDSISVSEAVGSEGMETITVINTADSPEYGSAKVRVQVTVGELPTTETNRKLTNGTYEFTVCGSGNNHEVLHTVTIQYENGAIAEARLDGDAVTSDDEGFVEIPGLAPGEYIVTEVTLPNGMELSNITGGTAYDLTDRAATVTVTSGNYGETTEATGKLTFINDYSTQTIAAEKIWTNPAQAKDVYVQLMRTTEEVCCVTVNLMDSNGNVIKTLNGIASQGADVKFSWKTDSKPNLIVENSNTDCRLLNSNKTYTLTITNVQNDLTIGATGNQNVKNARFVPPNSYNHAEIVESTIRLRQKNGWRQEWTLKGDRNNESNGCLAQYDSNGNIYNYFILESYDSQSDDYTTWYEPANGASEGTLFVYNGERDVQETEAKLKIIKVSGQNTEQALDGAVFRLLKMKDGNYTALTPQELAYLDSDGLFTVASNGFTLDGLTSGTYQILEVKPPEGYVLTDNIPITFTVEGESVSCDSGQLKQGVSFAPASGGESAIFTIANAPGAVLPQTGGRGTGLYMLSGFLMTLTAGGILSFRKRKSRL